MKRICHGAGAAFIAVSFAGTAQAVPLYFDFTGTTTGYSYTYPSPDGSPTTVDGYALGETVTGGFNFETDRLYDAGTFGFQHSWVDWQPANLTEPLTFLSFGGRDVSLPAYPDGSKYTVVSFVDACTPTCNPGWQDNFNLFTTSIDQEITTADFTGTTHRSSLFVSSAAYTIVPDYPYQEGFDYFDGATVDPFSIVSLPLFNMIGIYSEETVNCVAGACTNQSLQFNFSLDSVTRGIGPRASVPEPGTLGLFGMTALIALRLRRRRSAADGLR
jgi:hypothetical protein